MSDYYSNQEALEDELDYLASLDYDDLDDDYPTYCGGIGCGHCDYCEELYERDCIEAELLREGFAEYEADLEDYPY
jgi:hypothetical protein